MSAILTYARTQFKGFWRDPVAMFFTLLFPLLFLFVFGSIFKNTDMNFNIAIINNSQTEFAKDFVTKTSENDTFKVVEVSSLDDAKEKMSRGEVDSIVELPTNFGEIKTVGNVPAPAGEMAVYYEESSPQSGQTVASVMQGVLDGINRETTNYVPPLTVVQKSTSTAGLSQFDYTFSGMLAFTLLSLGIFGLASTLPAQKKNGVLRRIRATPFRAPQLILGTSLLFVALGVISLTLMMTVGLTVFNFDMRGDWLTFAVFVLASLFMMIGFGLAIGGWAKNENQAAPLSNLIAFPMMFLSGVFFPRFLMPEWLQGVTSWIPLTPVSDGIRYITTEGASLITVLPQLGMVIGWGLVAYLIAFKVFRWE